MQNIRSLDPRINSGIGTGRQAVATGWMHTGGTRISARGNPASPGPRFNAPAGWLDWPKRREPVAIIGKTVRLYHVLEPPAENH
ncbi:MAG: hypothetical protein ABI818_08625 [Acidobacteriota bacterium]